jgi:hypothetical protein
MCVARRLGMTMCSGPILICNDWERLSKMAIGDPCMLLATWHYQFKQLRMVRKKILVWQLWRNWRTTGDPPVLLWSGADRHKDRRRKRQPRAACTMGKASCWAETTRSLAAAWFSCSVWIWTQEMWGPTDAPQELKRLSSKIWTQIFCSVAGVFYFKKHPSSSLRQRSNVVRNNDGLVCRGKKNRHLVGWGGTLRPSSTG